MSDLLRIENATKTFGSYTAIDAVSFALKKNAILGLLGPNGAGKTTLLRLITQIVLPDSGQIYFNDTPLTEQHRVQLGYLPEERGLYRKMKVEEQLIYFAELRGMSLTAAKAQVADWLQRLEIGFLKDHVLETLSKGQQQKVQFISAVVHQPTLLILDEPFSGFDPANAEVIKKEIKSLHASGTTIIYSTHRMDTVEDVCTELVMLHKAQIVLQGTPDAIRRQFDSGQIRIVYSGNLPSQYLAVIVEQKQIDAHKVSYVLTVQESAQQMLKQLMDSGTVHAFEEYLPSMQDVFLAVVNKAQV